MLIFDTKVARQNFESKNVPFMPGGIHENVIMKDIIVDKLASGSYYIRFVYENESGLIMQHTEFEPTKRPFATDQEFQKSVDNQLNRMANNQLIPYFGYVNGELLSEEELEKVVPSYSGTSYFGYTQWLKETIEEISKTVKLRIKVVYGKKGYTSLPNTSLYESVEPMSSNKTRLVKLKMDQFEPIIVDDEKSIDVKSNINPLSSYNDVERNNQSDLTTLLNHGNNQDSHALSDMPF